MKKSFFSVFFLVFIACIANAQKADLLVKSAGKDLFLDHKVASKESFYSIGRLYNLHPKSIASFNKLDLTKGLQIDQKIRIPLLDTNFTQKGNSGTPIYYLVGDKEGLMAISNKHNGVLLTNLRQWNGLASDELKKDQKLVIGFLQSKEMPSVSLTPVTKMEVTAVKTEEKVEVTPDVAEKQQKQEEKEKEAELKAEKKEEKLTPPTVVKETRKPVIDGEGFFSSHFTQQQKNTPATKNETVTAGIFKTTSGWQDAKYYLLIDKVQSGTIIKITNPANGKAVYAKVLGEMSGIRQNEGLNIRMSNAAAAALNITEQDKFIVKVNY
jgi:LysM repeat protein